VSLRLALLVVAVISYASVGGSVFLVFVRSAPAKPGLWALRAVVVIADVLACLAIFAMDAVPPIQGGIGLALLLLSDALFVWCVLVTRRRRRSIAFSGDPPDQLLRRGPYAWTRHPFYSSYLLSYLAALVATLNPWLLAPLAAVWAVLFAAARQEEAGFAGSPMAGEYEAYAAKVGRFVPRW
jgi:protein-S-isoprenylcysteine O-methyltransferase Ste14